MFRDEALTFSPRHRTQPEAVMKVSASSRNIRALRFSSQESSIDNRQSATVNPLLGHELWAESYDELANPLLCLEERALSQYLPDVQGCSVADLACGTGRWLQRLMGLGAARCLGID